jgi:hypothetical protein
LLLSRIGLAPALPGSLGSSGPRTIAANAGEVSDASVN